MWRIGKVIGVVSCVSFVACGGGGGGSSVGDYTGTWDISALRVVNDCGAPLSSVLTNTIVVNQDNTRIVVNSGRRVLQGEINDRDGFTVADAYPGTDGCQVGAGYSFSDASDGEADVGVVLMVRCGSRECTVGYGGTATRRESRMLEKGAVEGFDSASIEKALSDSVLAGNGEEARGSVLDDVSELAELVAPAS